jgi:hypothetical protein
MERDVFLRTRLAMVIVGAAVLPVACAGSSGATRSSSSASPPATSNGSNSSSGPATTATETPEAAQAGDIPDNQAFVTFTFAAGHYSVKVPEGWAQSATGGEVSFTDKFNLIALSSSTAASAPTVDSAKTNELPAVQADTRNFSLRSVTTVTRAGQPVILVIYQGDSAPDAVTGKVVTLSFERYEYWKSGTEAIVTLSSPVGSDNVDPWRTITGSFTWTA